MASQLKKKTTVVVFIDGEAIATIAYYKWYAQCNGQVFRLFKQKKQ